MKKSFLLGIMVCLATVAFAQQKMEWYSYWGSNSNKIEPQRMVVDNAGNIYVAALFGGDDVAVESEKLESNSSSDKGDAVIVKMSPTKQVLWTYPIVESGNATVSDIAIDKKGNVVVLGAFTNSIRAGEKAMTVDDTNLGEAAIYVLKLTADGKALKAWQISALEATGGRLAIDSKNNIIITGILDGDATFIPGEAAEGDFQKSAQIFIAKYNAEGEHQWHLFSGAVDEIGASTFGNPSLAVDANDMIYVGSSLTGTTKLTTPNLTSTVSNAILVSLDATGKYRWAHMIDGAESDEAAAVAVSPIGQVALAVNHHSSDLHLDDLAEEFNNGYTLNATYAHTGIFAFDLAGEFKWFYDWGFCAKDGSGADAICHSMRCTDEGVWYVSGMQTGRYGGSRLPAEERTLPNGTNSGVETVDHQWLQHNTNGGWDCYLITLTRDGKLANAIRPGGTQYERGLDVALSPDKKSLYLLMHINVRNNIPYTCPDNIFDSFVDLYPIPDKEERNWASRKANYTLVNVFCPENDGSDKKYTADGTKGVFPSTMLVKYTMPEINPNKLPFFTVGETYKQKVSLAAPKGKAIIYPLAKYGDVTFANNIIGGTFENDNDRFVGFIAIDSIAVPGQMQYYEYDAATHRSLRSDPRNVRYMALTIEKAAEEEGDGEGEGGEQPGEEGGEGQGEGGGEEQPGEEKALDNVQALEASVYPTLCSDMLYINCAEAAYTVNIYTMSGVMIFSHDNVAGIQVGGHLAAGNYLVEVRAADKRSITTIIIQ